MLEVVFSDSAAGAMLAAIERPHVVGGAALKANGGGERDVSDFAGGGGRARAPRMGKRRSP